MENNVRNHSRFRNSYGTQYQNQFSHTVHADIQRSKLVRNSSHKTTFNAGYLVPIYCDEVLPGDTFEMDIAAVCRLSTPINPTMDTLEVDVYAFFVPNRIVWSNWQALNGENFTSAWTPATPPALVPQWDAAGVVGSGSIADYYGLPPNMMPSVVPVSHLPFRGYVEIWNEWFRDQNTQAPLPQPVADDVSGNWLDPNSVPLEVNKKHDYFSSCLPAPQKGESTLIPIELNQLIPVIATDIHALSPSDTGLHFTDVAGAGLSRKYLLGLNPQGSGAVAQAAEGTFDNGAAISPDNLWADPRGVNLTGSTISELRTAFQIQKLYEKDARGGTRYIEMLKAHFGVEAQDYRLQNPEFLGHVNFRVGIHQVAQTSSTDGVSPQGNLAAFGYAQTNGCQPIFRKSFVEHGYVHIFAVARYPKTYSQGVERFWFRKDRFDFYYPTLAHISEQPVYNKEIYALSEVGINDIFGYNEAWADYRYKPNRVSGQFRPYVDKAYKTWTYAEDYTGPVNLSDAWMRDRSRIGVDRTIAVTSAVADQIIMDIAFKCVCSRPMPVYSIPGLVDHF